MTTCPSCAADVPLDAGAVPWCERCGWNVDPSPPPAPRSPLARWWRRRSDRAAAAVHARLLAEGVGLSRGRLAIALLATAPVHLLTLAVAAGAVWLAVGDVVTPWLRVPGVVLAAGVLWLIVPWRGASSSDGRVLAPDGAPATFAVVARVAEAVGARPPHTVVVVPDLYNASFGADRRGRRVLELGLPLWNVLDDGARLALLGHELGHDVNRDVRRSVPMVLAARSLAGWSTLLDPRGVRSRAVAVYNSVSGTVNLAERVALWMLHGVHLLVLLLAAGMTSLRGRAQQPAEHRADLVAAQVAGRDAVLRLLDSLLLADSAAFALVAARNAGSRDPWAEQRRRFEALPARERARMERQGRLRLQRADASHPPTHYRIEIVRAFGAEQGSLDPADGALAAMDAELRGTRTAAPH
jgi:Zn-dependent protease with chaperone function